jgi:CCR4-NOT complex subunit CAF16
MGLLKPYSVLLLDEVTVDMDVLARLDLLAFLSEEAATRGATIVYATHIFDGLAGWATHVARVAGGTLVAGGRVGQVCPELVGGDAASGKLWPVVERWLRCEREEARAAAAEKEKAESAAAAAAAAVATTAPAAAAPPARRAEPAFPSRHMAFFR